MKLNKNSFWVIIFALVLQYPLYSAGKRSENPSGTEGQPKVKKAKLNDESCTTDAPEEAHGSMNCSVHNITQSLQDAITYLNSQKISEAKRLLTEILNVEGLEGHFAPVARYYRAKASFQQRLFEDALVDIDEAIKLSYKWFEPRFLQIKILKSWGKIDEAKEKLKSIYSLAKASDGVEQKVLNEISAIAKILDEDLNNFHELIGVQEQVNSDTKKNVECFNKLLESARKILYEPYTAGLPHIANRKMFLPDPLMGDFYRGRQRVLDIISDALKLEPNNVEAQIIRARIYFERKELNLVKEDFISYVIPNSNNLPSEYKRLFLLLKAIFSRQEKKIERSLEEITEFIHSWENEPRFITEYSDEYLLGIAIYLELKDELKQIDEDLLRASTNSINYTKKSITDISEVELIGFRFHAHYFRLKYYINRRETIDKIFEESRNVLKYGYHDTKVVKDVVVSICKRLDAYKVYKNPELVNEIISLIQLNPEAATNYDIQFKLGKMYTGLGEIYIGQEKFEEAEKCFNTAILLNPQKIAYERFGYVYKKMGKGDSEINAEIEKIASLHIDINNYDTQINLGAQYLKDKRYNEAEQCFKQAMRLNSKRVIPYCGLVLVYYHLGRYSDAQTLFIYGLIKFPKHKQLIDTLKHINEISKRLQKKQRSSAT